MIFKKITLQKTLFFLFSFMLLAVNTYAQKPKTYYINDQGDKSSKFYAKFKRSVTKKDNVWMVRDYYLNDSIRMTGNYLNKKLTTKTGMFKYYYPNGKVSRAVEYENNIRHGSDNFYFITGKKSKTTNYNHDEETGKWVWHNEDGSVENEVENVSDKFLSENYSNAEFVGGRRQLSEYIQKADYVLPVGMRAIYDKTITSFRVNKEGKVTEVDIIVHGTKKMDSAIIKHLYNMPKWKAAKKNGEYISVNFTLPIRFSNQSEKKLTDKIIAEAFYNSAINDYLEAKYEKAEFKTLQALRRNPIVAKYQYLLGQTYFKLNKMDFACENWAIAHSLDKGILTNEIKEFCNLE